VSNIVFLCGAKDFHAMDKFRLTTNKLGQHRTILLTDTLQGEGQVSRLKDNDNVHHLLLIDKFTFEKQSRIGNIWRNVLKFLLLPIQISKLKKYQSNLPDAIYHAIPIYYMLLCYYAKIKYVGTPQGSEILVRPKASKIYAYFAKKALIGADKVLVDSVKMKQAIYDLCSVKAIVMKNGFDTQKLLNLNGQLQRNKVISIRAIHPLYNIAEIIDARNNLAQKIDLDFIYPSSEVEYLNAIKKTIGLNDTMIGRLEREQLYKALINAKLVISIPSSDSSPRSVYESIFAGAAVAIRYSDYYNELPDCMKARIILIEIEKQDWLQSALKKAEIITSTRYVPSPQALDMCDENRTIQKIINDIYNIVI
jgi:hypothetical protein